MVDDRPMIDNVGKAIVNELLVRYLIKQMNNDGNLSVVTFKMEELKKAKKSSIEKPSHRMAQEHSRCMVG